MIETLYVIGCTFALLAVASRLRDVTKRLRQVTCQRDYAQALLQAPPEDGRHPRAVAGHLEGPQE
jgi:hypothetical protein